MRLLDDVLSDAGIQFPAWSSTYGVYDLSDDGNSLVGSHYNPSEAFLIRLDPVPEPSGVVLACVAIVGLGCAARKRVML
jgi:hypothetical protein